MVPRAYPPLPPFPPCAPHTSSLYVVLEGAVNVCTFPVYCYAKKLQNEKYKQQMPQKKTQTSQFAFYYL
jgi:hypothetical protein